MYYIIVNCNNYKIILILQFYNRNQWITYFENVYIKELSEKEKITLKPHSETLQSMVRQGIPHSLRPQLWMRFSGNKYCYMFLRCYTHSCFLRLTNT